MIRDSRAPRVSASTAMRIEGARGAALELARGRIVLICAVFALAYLAVGIRVFDLSILQGEFKAYGARDLAAAETARTDPAPVAQRADVVDRNGVLLATSLKTASLYADPPLVMEAEEAAHGIVSIFPDLSYADVLRKLKMKSRFVWIRRNITPQEQAKILELGQPGLAFEDEQRRIYPQGPLAAHIVGYTNVDGRGLSGIEQSFDTVLRAGSAEPVRLTLDIRIQHVLRREIQNQIAHFSAKAGAGLVMNVKTGEVLAAVSLPDFDPHAPADAAPDQKFNRFALGVYEPGSTFKIFSTAALFESVGASYARTFDARKPIKVGRFTISDYHPENRVMTVPEIFMHSSNIGTAHIAQLVGTEQLRAVYDRLGLLTPLECALNEVGAPLIPSPWRDVNTLTASYGHGIAVTPLQLVSAAATVANSGLRTTPVFILPEESIEAAKGIGQAERVISEETSEKMRALLRLAVLKGTGQKAEVAGFMVGGKTGTAEKAAGRRYDRSAVLSSFLGIFPMNDPEYAVFIMVDEPKGTKASYGYATGGWVAAPAVGRVVAAMGQILSLSPVDAETPDPAQPLARYLVEARAPAPAAPPRATVIPVAHGSVP